MKTNERCEVIDGGGKRELRTPLRVYPAERLAHVGYSAILCRVIVYHQTHI